MNISHTKEVVRSCVFQTRKKKPFLSFIAFISLSFIHILPVSADSAATQNNMNLQSADYLRFDQNSLVNVENPNVVINMREVKEANKASIKQGQIHLISDED